jgi:hypothetical protein
MFQQIMTFLEDHNIIPICQSGFRKHHSTATALINVFDDILRALDKGMMTLLTPIPPPPGGTAILPEYIHYYG